MRFLALLVSILCGIVLLIKMSTGDLDAQQVTGIGILALAVAVVSPADWPHWNHP